MDPEMGLSFSVWNYPFGEFSFWPTVGSDFDQPESALRPGEDAWERWWMLSPHAGEHTAGRVGSFQLFMGMGTPRNIGIRLGMGASGQEQAEWDQVFDGEMKAGGLRAS